MASKRPTADICDEHFVELREGRLHVFPPVFKSFGLNAPFSGQVVSLKVFQDNSLVKEELQRPGDGCVLMVDGGGSLRCALLGGNLAKDAERNGWEALVINGCVRDVAELKFCKVPIFALASNPVRTVKAAVGERNVPVNVAGVRVCPGDWCYGDEDGILVSNHCLGSA
eukprot:TRINITY_DN3330_c0_g1_i1.p1 TRINITY_DN3330_c0_g1~~TRINITY_DN3330_c0_g1_i1.p1  ORF type:complete len:169 (-),score=20.78 TRINITY_DN3330_c0_g1_i1:211-717(-)